MRVLGIETSCDETSAAVVVDGRLVLSNVVSSQIALHAPFGGVVPEIASRQHLEAISLVVSRALSDAGLEEDGIDSIGVTHGPGLAGALLVGLSFARGLALALDRPLIPVNHLDGHLHSLWLSRSSPPPDPPLLPMMALVVSGGHTELVLVAGHGAYRLVGRTRDDAAGEAFDKVGRLLGLSYPGGPAVQRAAAEAPAPVPFPRARLPGTYDFSFSGLKTAALHAAVEQASGQSPHAVRGAVLPRVDIAENLSAEQVANLAAGFQESVVDTLVTKTWAAADACAVRSIGVVGGVAANAALRARMCESTRVPVYISAPEFSTDNAAMIASAAFFTPTADPGADIYPSLALPVA